jgi:hypothetical protein
MYNYILINDSKKITARPLPLAPSPTSAFGRGRGMKQYLTGKMNTGT